MGQVLVPIGDAGVVVVPVVCVTVLDAHPEALVEEDRIGDVVAVDGDPLVVGVVPAVVVGDAVEGEGIVRLAPPRLVEPVLAAGAVQVGRPLLAVDHHHVVPFAPPSPVEIRDGVIAPEVVATAFGLQDDVIILPREAFLVGDVSFWGVNTDLVSPPAKGVFPVEFRVEISHPIKDIRFFVCLVVYVIVLHVRFLALVDQLDHDPLLEGHRHVTIEGTPRVHPVITCRRGREEHRLEGILNTMPQTEKVPEWAKNTGFWGVIPRDLDEHFPVMHIGGHPNMSKLAGPLDVRHNARFARLHHPAVGIPA